MKKILSILIIVFIYSCGTSDQGSGLKDITITTKSKEARDLYVEALDLYELRRQNSVEKRRENLNKAITLDPDFLLAKATLYSDLGTETNNSILRDVYERREEVSEMEAGIIEFLYNWRTNYDPEVASYNITMLADDNPDIPRLRFWSGLIKSYNPGEIYEAIDDLEVTLELDPNHFGAKLLLIAKHLQFGVYGVMLPTGEIDYDYLKTMIDDIEKNNSDNSYTHVVVGNYYRTMSDFDKAIESYARLENYQDQEASNLYTSNHYRALSNTFKGDYAAAESFFRKNIELGNQFNAYFYFPQMHLFNNNFDGAIEALNEYEDNLINLELPAQQELNSLVDIQRIKFLCYAHNQQENESLRQITLTKEARVNAINLRKNRMTEDEYDEGIKNANYLESTFRIWHDILFGKYDDAKSKLTRYMEESKKINRPNPMHNYLVLNGLVELNLGNPEKALEFFNQTNRFNGGFFGITLDDDYYDYFKGLAHIASGNIDQGNELFELIASKNFYGIQSALVRNLAKDRL